MRESCIPDLFGGPLPRQKWCADPEHIVQYVDG